MKNRKRLMTSVLPPRPKEYGELEKFLVLASGASELPWKEITFTLRAGQVPQIKIDYLPTQEDVAAAVAGIKANEH